MAARVASITTAVSSLKPCIAAQPATRPAGEAVPIVVIGPHRKTPFVKSARQRFVALAMLAQPVDDKHRGPGPGAGCYQPVTQAKLRAVGGVSDG